MKNTNMIDFDNEMKNLSAGVYEGNEKLIPSDWTHLKEGKNERTGFHAEAYYKNEMIVIAIRGTDEVWKDFFKEDIGHLAMKKLPNQFIDAQKFYEKIKSKFPKQKIVFTGHSLGGSLAQLMANQTGCEAVTFNAYGVGDLLPGSARDNFGNIRNYGHIDDTVFNFNLNRHLGQIYILGHKENGDYITRSINGDYFGGIEPKKYHYLENIGDLEDAIEYKPYPLKGRIKTSIDYKDVDNERIFTNEEIGQMSTDEFNRLEGFIIQQMKKGKVMPEAFAKQQTQAGNLIYVNSYTRDDGIVVKGYYRSKPSF